MKREIYFGTSGITSTSANTLANWAKEYVKDASSMRFYNCTLSLIGSGEESVISQGLKTIDVSFLDKKIKAYSLIAWLREAIKAREELKQEIENIDLDSYCKIKGINIPKRPEKENSLTEEEYWDSRSTKERNRYYELETACSVYGKFIHPNSPFAEARDKLMEIANNPINVSKGGRDTLIYKYTPSIDPKIVEQTFFSLQNKHRELQSQLNTMKYECESACMKSRTEAQNKYSSELKEYNAKMREIESEMAKYKTAEIEKLLKLKIIIPDSLKEIYKEVSKLGDTLKK